MQETDVQLGQRVVDTISGYEGVVTTIGDHLTGCTRVGCSPTEEDKSPNAESFFYEEQLNTEEQFIDDVDVEDESEFETGQPVIDVVTGFKGIVSVVNYKLYNCPQILVQSTEEADESEWFDEPRLREYTEGVSYSDTFSELEEVSETGAISDAPSENLSR